MSLGSGPGLERLLSEQAECTLVRLEDGGFRLEAMSAESIRVKPVGEGWRVTGKGPWADWELSREAPDQGGGLRLNAGDDWVGRTLAFAGTGEMPGLRHLLLADGRLFRMIFCGSSNGSFELRGWETSGAYLIGRPADSSRTRWTLTPTAAGACLEGLEQIQILFAAEIVQSDAGHGTGRSGEGPGAT